jgi:hypothetical protein
VKRDGLINLLFLVQITAVHPLITKAGFILSRYGRQKPQNPFFEPSQQPFHSFR